MIATEDGVVRNDYIEQFMEMRQNEMGEIHYVEGADHTDVVFNENYGSQVVRNSVAFLDKVIDARHN